jgi:hypothetical protein
LDEVRQLFFQQYLNVMGQSGGIFGPDGAAVMAGGGGGVLTGLLENLAEKVGIRPARSGFY